MLPFPSVDNRRTVIAVDTESHQLADLILAIEAEMRCAGLWEATPPEVEALSSLAPFCHDTLTFLQWLQWVFLPKMKAVVETGNDFPASSDITPLAEYSFSQLPHTTDKLLTLVRRFDQFINRTP